MCLMFKLVGILGVLFVYVVFGSFGLLFRLKKL